MLLKKSDNSVTVEITKVTVDNVKQLDEMIAKLVDAKNHLISYQQKRLEESTQPLWEDNL